MFSPSNIASSPSSSFGTWIINEDVHSSENRGWPLPSTETGKKEGGLSSNVPVQGRTAYSLLSKHAKRGTYFQTNLPARVKSKRLRDLQLRPLP